jgi:hypothetical protein
VADNKLDHELEAAINAHCDMMEPIIDAYDKALLQRAEDYLLAAKDDPEMAVLLYGVMAAVVPAKAKNGR